MNPTMNFPEDLPLDDTPPAGIPLSVGQRIDATIDGVDTTAKVLGFATMGFVVEMRDGKRGYIDYPKDLSEIREAAQELPVSAPGPAACERPDMHWWGDEETAERGEATPNECRICGVTRDSFPMLNNGLRLGEHADDCTAGLHGPDSCDCSGSFTLEEASELDLIADTPAPEVAAVDPTPPTATSSEPALDDGDAAARELEEMAAAVAPPPAEPEPPAEPAPSASQPVKTEAINSDLPAPDSSKPYQRPSMLPQSLNGLVPSSWGTSTPTEYPVTKVAAWLKSEPVEPLVKRMLALIDEHKAHITEVQQLLKMSIPFNNPIRLRDMFLTLEGAHYTMCSLLNDAEAILDKAQERLQMPPGTSVMCRDENGNPVPATGCKVKDPDHKDFIPRYKELTVQEVKTYLDADAAAFRRFRNEMQAIVKVLENRLFNIKAFQRDGGM